MDSENVKPSMSLGESLTSVFGKYATFTGRARRSEYWWFYICYFVINFVLNLVGLAFLLGEMPYDLYSVFQTMCLIFFLGLFLPSLAVAVRRLHDIGKSGWNILLCAIPIVGVIIVLVWMCKDSDVDTNKYGESPKYCN